LDQGAVVKKASAMRMQGNIKEAEAHTSAKLLMAFVHEVMLAKN
jgi:hypothetical protein